MTHDKAALESALGLDSSSARIEVHCLLQAVLQVNRNYRGRTTIYANELSFAFACATT